MWKYILYSAGKKSFEGRIEASDYPDFHRSELLHEFAVIPDAIAKVSLAPSRPYRYFRFQDPGDGFPSGPPPLAVSSFPAFARTLQMIFAFLTPF